VNNTHVKQFTEKKRRVSSAYSRCSAEIQSGPGAFLRAAFEEMMPMRQVRKN